MFEKYLYVNNSSDAYFGINEYVEGEEKNMENIFLFVENYASLCVHFHLSQFSILFVYGYI